MSKQMKNGKLPISSKREIDEIGAFEEQSILDVDKSIKNYLEGQGNTVRWINAIKFKASGGFNSKGWQPVRIEDIPKEVIHGTGAAYGSSADGFLLRNDMMLAKRSKEATDRHEKQLKMRADLASGKTKQNANAIREGLGKYGKVIEGYDENGDD